VKKESQAILTARSQRKITPVNALKQLSELEEPVIKFILSRPALTFTSIEAFRAEVLLENMRISKARCLTGPQATKILVEREEKPVNRMMTQRAMRRASKLHSDLVRYDKKKGSSRLILIKEAHR
jgi:aryl-alcohol dehydrogenase-like predicted oxidoreductase